MKIFIIDDAPSAGCGGFVAIGVLGICGVVSLIAMPTFYSFYLTNMPITYVVIAILLLIDTLLYMTEIPGMLVAMIEAILISILLICNNITSVYSFYGGAAKIERSSESSGIFMPIFIWITLFIQCIIGAILLAALISLISAGIVKTILIIKDRRN